MPVPRGLASFFDEADRGDQTACAGAVRMGTSAVLCVVRGEGASMAFVRLALFPEGTEQHYRRLARVMSDVPVPEERLLFAAGPVAGGWQVVQVWTSLEYLEVFNREHFLPALRALGDTPFPRAPVVTDFETRDLSLRTVR